MKKIYDTFLFFNELELLELRLNILNDVVDKFVIVESTKTFSSKELLNRINSPYSVPITRFSSFK
jgi:hypothetical protein